MRKVKFDKDLCIGCKRCHIQCVVRHSESGDIGRLRLERNVMPPRLRVRYDDEKDKIYVLRCLMCSKPKCVEVCKDEGMVQDEDGYVHFTDRCTACLACVEACPFDAIFVKGEQPYKCDLCLEFPAPACVEACKVDAMTYVEL
jgi:carbon-monoxide dehydrogenase iron sulfur subunit